MLSGASTPAMLSPRCGHSTLNSPDLGSSGGGVVSPAVGIQESLPSLQATTAETENTGDADAGPQPEQMANGAVEPECGVTNSAAKAGVNTGDIGQDHPFTQQQQQQEDVTSVSVASVDAIQGNIIEEQAGNDDEDDDEDQDVEYTNAWPAVAPPGFVHPLHLQQEQQEQQPDNEDQEPNQNEAFMEVEEEEEGEADFDANALDDGGQEFQVLMVDGLGEGGVVELIGQEGFILQGLALGQQEGGHDDDNDEDDVQEELQDLQLVDAWDAGADDVE